MTLNPSAVGMEQRLMNRVRLDSEASGEPTLGNSLLKQEIVFLHLLMEVQGCFQFDLGKEKNVKILYLDLQG